MASSQSYIHKPEAPVAPFDLNIFTKVLMYKQAQYDRGADIVQSKISQLENQAVIGDAQKKYLSEKINGVIEGVNGMGGKDLSDRNQLNQTSSYIDSVTKDPIIASAISNTRTIQKGVSFFEKLKQDAAAGKKGVYYNPANEYDYMENVNDYMRRSKTDAAASYNDRPIAPPVDVNKQIMNAAKDVVASKYTDRDGNNRFILKTGEVVTPERLYQHALTQVQTDPTLANQIRINAKYNYLQRDANGNLSESQLSNLKQTYIQGTNNKINSLRNELVTLAQDRATAGTGDEQARIQSQIDNVAQELSNHEKDRSSRLGDIDSMIMNNPEQAASMVYTNKLLEGVVAARAYKEETVKFDQAGMFQERMNFQRDNEMFDRSIEERKLALETAELALKGQKLQLDANGKPIGDGVNGIISEETSLPSNLRKSSQEVQFDQIRGVEMQQANLQQDYYHYLYQYKNASNLVQKDGNIYKPNEAGKALWANEMQKLKDVRAGKKIPTSIDPEFIKIANKMQELDLVKKQYQDNIIDVNREALNIKRKELGLSDNDYETFLRGKAIVDALPEDNNSVSTIGVRAKDYSKLPTDDASRKAYDTYRKWNKSLVVDKDVTEKIYQAQSSQILPRTYVPIGLKESDLKARANSLVGQISGRGYYDLNSGERPEKTRGQDINADSINYLGDSYMDLGDGLKPYVKAQIVTGTGEKKTSKTVFIDVDDTYASNFRNFAQNVNEVARQQVLRTDKLDYDSMSSDGKNVIQTRVVKKNRGTDDEESSIQIFVPYDENGKRITPVPYTLRKMEGVPISQAIEMVKGFANDYSTFYKAALAAKKRPTLKQYIDILNK